MINVNVVEVIEAVGVEMHDKGNHFAGICPLHNDKNPSLVVYKNRLKRFFCFGCGASGDAIDFIRQLKGYSFLQAVKYLNVLHKSTIRLGYLPTALERIVAEEKAGVNVKKKYGKLLEHLLAQEMLKLAGVANEIEEHK